MRKFLVSLEDVGLDRHQFRDWQSLFREQDWRQRARFLDRLGALLERIPPVERDIIDLYFFKGKTQEIISRMLGITQQAISHRMYTAFRRLIFMLEQPEVCPEQMRVDLGAIIPNPTTVAVLCDFARTSSQTETAHNLNLPQQRVNWHLNSGIRTLQEHTTIDGLFYGLFFGNLMDHKNILRPERGLHGAERRRDPERAAASPDAGGSEGRAPQENAGVA